MEEVHLKRFRNLFHKEDFFFALLVDLRDLLMEIDNSVPQVTVDVSALFTRASIFNSLSHFCISAVLFHLSAFPHNHVGKCTILVFFKNTTVTGKLTLTSNETLNIVNRTF